MTLIAGSLPLAAVLDCLRQQRPVFHSEADLQHALGQVIHELDTRIQVRLKVKQRAKEYLDILCFGHEGRTAIEPKYRTRRWTGVDPSGEQFQLLDYSAHDLGRHASVSDIERLERFRAATAQPMNGIAALLTDEPSFWTGPRHTRVTRDQEFRLHTGVTLTGTLRWAKSVANERRLAGSYTPSWEDWSRLDEGPLAATFRLLSIEVPC